MAIRRRYKLWLIVVTVILLFTSAFRLPANSWPMLAMWPVLEVLHAPVQWWTSLSQWFVDRHSLQSRYLALQKQAQQQAALIQEATSLREENRQLRRILEIVGIQGYHWHAAKVRGRSPGSMSQKILIQVNNASADDVIVSSEGLVGLVDSATADYATVRTIFDASLAVPVTVPGSILAALSVGQGNHLEINFVPAEIAPAVGETLYTSGAGGLFPPGIAVARVTEVQPLPGQLFALVMAEPVAHWQRDNWLAVASRLSDIAQ